MQDHPDLKEKHLFYRKKHQDLISVLEKLKEQEDRDHKEFWQAFEKTLVEKGLLTDKELKEDIGLSIRDGVLFKYSRAK